MAIDDFELTASDKAEFDQVFQLVLGNVDFEITKFGKGTVQFPIHGGIYFWLMNLNGKQIKVYIGMTENLESRTKDYLRGFQPNSVNDFKLRFFQEFIKTTFGTAGFDLYFADFPNCTRKQLATVESGYRSKFDPIFDEIPLADEDTSSKLKFAYGEYLNKKFRARIAD